MKKFFSEFKEFINRGNVMDLAVAVIIGGAFTSIVTALTTNIINPLISVIAGGGADTISGLVVPGTDIDFGAFKEGEGEDAVTRFTNDFTVFAAQDAA